MTRATTSLSEDWTEVAVGELCARGPSSMSTGPFGSSIGSRFFRVTGVPVLRGSNLSADSEIRVRDEDLVFLTEAKAAEFARSTVRAGDLVFTCWGTINQVGLIDDSASYDAYVISNKQMKMTPDRERCDPEFLYYLFSGPEMQREILGGSIGSSVPGFNLTRLRAMRVLLPPLHEQRAIAVALGDVDRAIGSLRRLLEKERGVLLGTAQVLLDGGRRLPGFDAPLTTFRLGDVARVLKGGGLAKSRVHASGSRECLLYGELFTTYGRVIDRVVSRTNDAGGLLSRHGDVLIPGSTTTVGADLAIAAALLRDNVALGGDTLVMRRKDGVTFDPVFLAYYLTHCRSNEIASRTQGITIVHLYGRHLVDLELTLPTLPEQIAVAAVLRDMEVSIGVTQSELAKLRLVKQGMMQMLLTGRARLSMEAAA
jgi:type I restriction enzyme, S subunit